MRLDGAGGSGGDVEMGGWKDGGLGRWFGVDVGVKLQVCYDS